MRSNLILKIISNNLIVWKGQLFLERHDTVSAGNFFKSAVKLDSSNFFSLYKLANWYQINKSDSFYLIVRKLEKLNCDKRDSLRLLDMKFTDFWSKSEFKKAQAILALMNQINSESHLTMYNNIQYLNYKSDNRKLMEYLDARISKCDSSKSSLYLFCDRANAILRLAENNQIGNKYIFTAISDIEFIRKKDSSHHDMYNRLGSLCFYAGFYDESLINFEQAKDKNELDSFSHEL